MNMSVISSPMIELIRSDRGRKKLALEGFLYAHDRLCMDGREMWRCDRRADCKARIHTQGGRLIQRINEHTHGPDVEKIKQAKSYLDVVRLRPEDQAPGMGICSAIGVETGGMDTTTSEFQTRPELPDQNWLASIGLPPGAIKQEIDVDVYPESNSNGLEAQLGAVSSGLGAGSQISPDAVSSTSESNSDPIFTDPAMFWQSVHEAGAFDELVGEIANHLEKYRTTFQSRQDLRPQIATKLSGIVDLMEISSQIRTHLQTKKLLTLAETDILQNEIQALERKALEQKRRQLEAKRKATLFQQLVNPRPPGSASKSPELGGGGEPSSKKERRTANSEGNFASSGNNSPEDDVTRPVAATEAAKSVSAVFPETEHGSSSSSSF